MRYLDVPLGVRAEPPSAGSKWRRRPTAAAADPCRARAPDPPLGARLPPPSLNFARQSCLKGWRGAASARGYVSVSVRRVSSSRARSSESSSFASARCSVRRTRRTTAERRASGRYRARARSERRARARSTIWPCALKFYSKNITEVGVRTRGRILLQLAGDSPVRWVETACAISRRAPRREGRAAERGVEMAAAADGGGGGSLPGARAGPATRCAPAAAQSLLPRYLLPMPLPGVWLHYVMVSPCPPFWVACGR